MISQGPQHRSQEQYEPVTDQANLPAVAADAHEHSGFWQRLLDAFYEARMRSAARQIEQHREAIALWRRHLAQRKEHLHLIRRR